MINLKEYKTKADELSDFLQWCIMIEDGVILNHDGSFQKSFRYRGSDLNSADDEELVIVTSQLNNALRRITGNWCIYIESRREKSKEYPHKSFPDVCTMLIDSEREATFAEKGSYFENKFYFTLLYLPPQDKFDKLEKIFIDSKEVEDSEHERIERQLDFFKSSLNKIFSLFKEIMPECVALTDEETLEYLHSCVSTKRHPIAKPIVCEYLNDILADTPLYGGLKPTLGDHFLSIVSIKGFPQQSQPAILDALNRVDFEYRWVTRYIPLDKIDAQNEMESYRRQWFSNRKGIFTKLREAITRSESAMVDTEALGKFDDTQMALEELANDYVSYGKYTQLIVLTDTDQKALTEKTRIVEKIINSRGFSTVVESTNAVSAWFSSIPCIPRANIRKYFMNSLNLSHMFPLSAVWAGESWNEHFNAPALMRCVTAGSTPFWFNLHIEDVGHTMVVGQTGSGKSVLLNTIESQFRGYKNSKIYVFDKGGSSRALTAGVGGTFYDLGSEEEGQLSFQPLANIDNEDERSWALEWILQILLQEAFDKITPDIKTAVWTALNQLSVVPQRERTMTGLCVLIQNKEISQALGQFIGKSQISDGGAYGNLFDSDVDNFTCGTWQTFEMERLIEKKAAVMPALLYIFHRLEQNCNGEPTIIVLDECWFFLDIEIFASKIREWLKVMRKNNVSIIFATQNLDDITNSRIAPAIIDSCLTKVFLPDKSATTQNKDAIYNMFNLNKKERLLIAEATRQKEYYYKSPKGSRKFELGLKAFTLAYVASASKEDQAEVRKILSQYPQEEFNEHWVRYKNMPEVVSVINSVKPLVKKEGNKNDENSHDKKMSA